MSERQWEKFIPDDCGGWKNVGDLKTDAEVLAEMDTEALVLELARRGRNGGRVQIIGDQWASYPGQERSFVSAVLPEGWEHPEEYWHWEADDE